MALPGAAPLQAFEPAARSSRCIYILGADMRATTLLAPFMKPTMPDEGGKQVPIEWCVAVSGVHSLDTKQCKSAAGILLVYSSCAKDSVRDLTTMAAPIPQFTPPGMPVLALGIYDSRKLAADPVDSWTQVRTFCGQKVGALVLEVDVADVAGVEISLQGFVKLCLRPVRPTFYRFVRHNQDPNAPWDFRVDDVFAFEQCCNGYNVGSYLGQRFTFDPSFAVEVAPPKKEQQVLNPHQILRVRFYGTEHRTDQETGKEYIAFLIEVHTVHKKWTVSKRFRALVDFHEHIHASYPKVKFPPFPKRTALKASASTVEKRRNALEQYFNFLLTSPQLRSGFLEERYITDVVDILLDRKSHIPDVVVEGMGSAPQQSETKALTDDGSAWEEIHDSAGRTYYWSTRTGETSWSPPSSWSQREQQQQEQTQEQQQQQQQQTQEQAKSVPPPPPPLLPPELRGALMSLAVERNGLLATCAKGPFLPEEKLPPQDKRPQVPHVPEEHALRASFGRVSLGRGSVSAERSAQHALASPVAEEKDEEAGEYDGEDDVYETEETQGAKSTQDADPSILRAFAVAHYSMTARNQHELTFSADDTIEILDDIDENWSYGYVNGAVGAFPKSYVRFLDHQENRTWASLLPPVPYNMYPHAAPAPLDPNRPYVEFRQGAKTAADHVYAQVRQTIVKRPEALL